MPNAESRVIRFDMQPTLSDALVRLRPLQITDFEALFSVAADPLIWEQHPARTRHEPAVFAAFFADALASRGALVIEDATTGSVVGSSRYFEPNVTDDRVEIGWTFLAREYWGRGVNAAVKRLMMRHALNTFGGVRFRVGPDNIRSQRAVELIGAERIGITFDATGTASVEFKVTRAGFASGLGRA
jgi:N-acetyltransferase